MSCFVPRSPKILAAVLVFAGIGPAVACSSSSESDEETTRAQDGHTDDTDSGAEDLEPDSDDDGSGGANGDDSDTDDDSSPGEGEGDDDVGDDDVGDADDEKDASTGTEEPDAQLPDGFVSIDTRPDGGLQILCGTDVCACADGQDNDGDGLSDGMDSECTGPFDHDEGSFATGIPGDNQDPKWQDCFFDGNSGAGDDGCRYHTDCLTGEADPSEARCAPTQECRDYCQPLTPPGCDCFGCCEVEHDGVALTIQLSEQCSLENLDDELACPRCEPTDTCKNECGECEICLGETIDDLPDSCFPPPTGMGGAGGSAPGGAGGGAHAGAPGTGGTGNRDGGAPSGGSTSDPPDSPSDPGNTCDFGAPCVESADCGDREYCSLGCCVIFDRAR